MDAERSPEALKICRLRDDKDRDEVVCGCLLQPFIFDANA